MNHLSILILPVFYLFNLLLGYCQQYPEYVTLMQQYVQYRSTEYQEKEAGLFLMEQCNKYGLVTEVLMDEDTAFNFAASIYPLHTGKPNIIFLNHIDVVPIEDSAKWEYPPFAGVVKDSIIYGRGAIDNKAMAVAQLFAIIQFAQKVRGKDPDFNVTLLSVSGEETGGFRGARIIADNYLEKLNACLILGEGGSGVRGIIQSDPLRPVFGISLVDKSKLILELELHLISSGHGSVPPEEYAAKEMIFALNELLETKQKIIYHPISVAALKELGNYESGIRGFIQKHFTLLFFRPIVKRVIRNNPELRPFFSNTIALTHVNTPDVGDNQLAQSIEVTLDCRVMPGYSIDKFVRKLDRRLNEDRILVKRKFLAIASNPTDSPEYFKALSSSIRMTFPDGIVLPMIFPATTDNIYFRAKGIPVLGIFPALFSMNELQSIHAINEHIHINRLKEAIEVYYHFLNSFNPNGSILTSY